MSISDEYADKLYRELYEKDKEIKRLREVLREAKDRIVEWAGYASPYFREKHDLEGDLAHIDAALEAKDE